ncbi:uncharacterized protein LOC127358077 [Dicentrarchus labrax]|uniref:uncharacterized protein LOC127358077 n=1 Tax=Dicentrarchus labrax TaxID=13489 RepID=UPI0021F60B0D|nr:uncharacterized protein LOC127358077 [Dicentrarchus labrax]
MDALPWILSVLCAAGAHLSSASPVLRSALVVQPGQNVSLTCNLTSSKDVTWYVLRSDQLLPLLTVKSSRVGGSTVDFHTANKRRFSGLGDGENGTVRMVRMEILGVEETDAGLYFCTGRREGDVHVDRGINLVVNGVDGDSARLPCWSLGICVLPALLVLFIVIIIGLYLCSGRPAACCCRSNMSLKVAEDESLHYSSLKHPDKPRLSSRGKKGLAEDNVTYSAVTIRQNPNGSHDRK